MQSASAGCCDEALSGCLASHLRLGEQAALDLLLRLLEGLAHGAATRRPNTILAVEAVDAAVARVLLWQHARLQHARLGHHLRLHEPARGRRQLRQKLRVDARRHAALHHASSSEHICQFSSMSCC